MRVGEISRTISKITPDIGEREVIEYQWQALVLQSCVPLPSSLPLHGSHSVLGEFRAAAAAAVVVISGVFIRSGDEVTSESERADAAAKSNRGKLREALNSIVNTNRPSR